MEPPPTEWAVAPAATAGPIDPGPCPPPQPQPEIAPNTQPNVQEVVKKTEIVVCVTDVDGKGQGGGKDGLEGSPSENETKSKDVLPRPKNMEPLSRAKDQVSWLLRFFRSDFFDVWVAIAYLHKYKDEGVRDYLCNELFKMPISKVEFYLPQLGNMCVCRHTPEDVVERFILYQCCRHINFAVLMVWMLDSYIQDTTPNTPVFEYCVALRDQILYKRAEFREDPTQPKPQPSPSAVLKRGGLRLRALERSFAECPQIVLPSGFGAQGRANHGMVRSYSHHTMHSATLAPPPPGSQSAEECRDTHPPAHEGVQVASPALRSFLDQVETVHQMQHGIPGHLPMMHYLEPQMNFINALIGIGDRLATLTTREMRKAQLFAELTIVNLNLPSRVYLPLVLTPNGPQHHIVRIPPQDGVILNSKDKVPFMVCVEVLECTNMQLAPLPPKRTRRNSNEIGIGPLAFAIEMNDFPSEEEDALRTTPQQPGTPVMTPERTLVKTRTRTFQDESVLQLKEPWEVKRARIMATSPYGTMPNWRLYSIIVKCGDDLRQEVLASQLVAEFKNIFEEEGLPLWLRPVRVLVTSNRSGLIETIVDTLSIHSIKKQYECSLFEYFVKEYGSAEGEQFQAAQRRFIESFAAYSLVTYFLQVKDRHNSNILLDQDGRVIHIDYGFFISNSPRNLGFEAAPFKLTSEFAEVLGGLHGPGFQLFRDLMMKGFVAARKHSGRIVTLVNITRQDSKLPCFVGGPDLVRQLEERFCLNRTEEQLREHVNALIDLSYDHISTRLYDNFQYYTNGIL